MLATFASCFLFDQANEFNIGCRNSTSSYNVHFQVSAHIQALQTHLKGGLAKESIVFQHHGCKFLSHSSSLVRTNAWVLRSLERDYTGRTKRIFDVSSGTVSINARSPTNLKSLCGITFRRIGGSGHHEQRTCSIWVRYTEPSRTCATHSLHNPPINNSQCVVEHTHTKFAADLLHCNTELFRTDSTTSGYIKTRTDIKSTSSNLLRLFRKGQGPQR